MRNAQTISRTLQRIIKIAARDPMMQYGDNYSERYDSAAWKDFTISPRVRAHLCVLVGAEFEHLKNTDRWLPNFSEVDLNFDTFATAISDSEARDTPDPVSEVTVHLRTTDTYDDSSLSGVRHQLHVPSYENGLRLNLLQTETVISVLALIADRSEAA